MNFKTIYPGWYSGRATHIHFRVRTYSSSGTTTYNFASQLFFDDTVTDSVSASAPYNSRGTRDTRNSTDNIYDSRLLRTLTKTSTGYAGTFAVGLQIS